MTAENPDPAETAGLDSGGEVEPGDTPPTAATTAGPNNDPPQRTLALPTVFLVGIGIIVLLVVLGLAGRIAGFY